MKNLKNSLVTFVFIVLTLNPAPDAHGYGEIKSFITAAVIMTSPSRKLLMGDISFSKFEPYARGILAFLKMAFNRVRRCGMGRGNFFIVVRLGTRSGSFHIPPGKRSLKAEIWKAKEKTKISNSHLRNRGLGSILVAAAAFGVLFVVWLMGMRRKI
jgi:hypothetical protein